jgi:hypothetical protein
MRRRYPIGDAIPQGAPTPLVMLALGGRKQSPTMAMDERLLLAVVHQKAATPLSTQSGGRLSANVEPADRLFAF